MKSNKKVLNLLGTVPYGKITTYKELGIKTKLHPRKIASILKKNKNTQKYPCYKVVMSSGKIGGYNKGIVNKIRLLQKQGIVTKNNKIDLRKYLHKF